MRKLLLRNRDHRDIVSRPKEIQIIDQRPIVRDFRTPPTVPMTLTARQRQSIERMQGRHGILYDALPAPFRHSHSKDRTHSSSSSSARKPCGWTGVIGKQVSPKPQAAKE